MPIRHNRFHNPRRALLAACVWSILGLSIGQSLLVGAEGAPEQLAERLLARKDLCRGIWALPRAGDGQLALALAQDEQANLLVHALFDDETHLTRIRQQARAGGLLGSRLYAESGDAGRLPLANDYVNVLLITDLTDDKLAATPVQELVRVLTPQTGVAVVGLAPGQPGRLTRAKLEIWAASSGLANVRVEQDDLGLFAYLPKPALRGAADWTHRLYDAASHPLSPDTACAWPLMTQWLGRPLLAQEPVLIAAGGRLAAVHLRGWGGESLLSVQDLHNGRLLWHRVLDKAALATRTSAIVLLPEALYLAEKDQIHVLHPATGEQLEAISCAELGPQVKWFAIAEDRLHAMSGPEDPPVLAHQTWKFFGVRPEQLQVLGRGSSIAAYDLKSRKWLWRRPYAENTLDEGYVCVKDGLLYLLVHGQHLACLNAADGIERWTNAGVAHAVSEFKWGDSRGHLGALMASDKYLGFLQPGLGALVMSRQDGAILWQPTATSMMFKDDWLLSKGDWRRQTPPVASARTGEAAEAFPDLYLGGGCGSFSLTPNLACGQTGITYDFLQKVSLVKDHNSAMPHKAPCLTPPFVADGRVVYGTVSCVCGFPVRGTIVQAPAQELPPADDLNRIERLQQYPGFETCAALTPDAGDWPTFRADEVRSNASRAKVPQQASARWCYRPERRLAADWKLPPVHGPEYAYTPADPFAATPETSQVTAAGDLIFVSDFDGTVTALERTSGQVTWRFFTPARVYAPPTVWAGRLYIGSGDGCVYCLEATTGRQLWTYQVAPRQRRIMVYGDLVNTWPITGGVLVHDGVAYASAGILNIDAASVAALDARTGAVRWRNDRSGHLDPVRRIGVSAVGFPAIARNRLWIRDSSYDLATGQCRAFPAEKLADEAGAANALLNMYTGFFADKYLVRGGRRYFDDPPSTENRANFPLAFLELTPDGLGKFPDIQLWEACRVMPAWDARHLLAFPQSSQQRRGDHREDLICRDVLKTLAELADKGQQKGTPLHGARFPTVPGPSPDRAAGETFSADAQLWTKEYPFVRAAVLAENAAVVAYLVPGVREGRGDPVPPVKHFVAAFTRDRGELIWEVELPGEPIADGLSIARDGTVLVRLLDGGLAAVGDLLPGITSGRVRAGASS